MCTSKCALAYVHYLGYTNDHVPGALLTSALGLIIAALCVA